MTLWKWSTTAASNATADATINWAEGQAPGSVNDSARAMMAAVAKYRDDNNWCVTGGLVNAYTVTTGQGLTTYVSENFSFNFQVPITNTGPSTIAIDGLAAVPMYILQGVPLSAGDLVSGTIVKCVYLSGWSGVAVIGFAKTLSMAALSGLTPAVDTVPYYTGVTTAATAPFTAAGRAVVGAANADAQLTALTAYPAQRASKTQNISATGTLTIDVSLGTNVNLTVTGNITSITANNLGAGYVTIITLFITNSGAYTMSGWPGSWPGNVLPVITSGVGKRDTIMLVTTDAGVSWRGFIVAQND
jgi:hypothetical protein